MKKIAFLLMMVTMTMIAVAQNEASKDYIYKKDYEKIEAKIIEVSSTEVKYKEWNNPEGPVFILSTDEIGKIEFSNGTIKTYAETKDKTTNTTVTMAPTTTFYTSNAALTTNQPGSSYIIRSGQQYIYNGEVMKGKKYAQFLNENCPAAYQQYMSGKKVATAGWVLLGSGVGLEVGTMVALILSGQAGTLRSSGASALSILYITGGVLELACVPTLCVGYARMHKSADTFNLTCRPQTQAYWSVNASPYGLGLALHF